MVSTRTSATASQPRPVTHEHISLSLTDVVDELAKHVPAVRRPLLTMLKQQLVNGGTAEQQAKVKEQLIIIAGADTLRTAVTALVGGKKKPSNKISDNNDSLGLSPLGDLPPLQSTMSANAGSVPLEEPPMPASMPLIFGGSHSDNSAAFKKSVLHSLHCTSRNCVELDCPAQQAKLERLRKHVGTCSEQTCMLCSIWRYLEFFRDPLPRSHAPAAEDPYSPSMQLLPLWQHGRMSQMSSQDTLSQIMQAVMGNSSVGRAGNQLPMESQLSQGHLPAKSSQPNVHSYLQGILPPAWSSFENQLPMPPAPPIPRVATAGSASASAPAAAAPAPSSSLPLPIFDFADAEGALGEGSPSDARGELTASGRPKRGTKRPSAEVVAGGPVKKSSTFARTSSGLRVPLPNGSAHALPPLPGIKMDAMARNLSLSGGNLNLAELLKSYSMGDLGMSLGLSSSDLLGSLGDSSPAAPGSSRDLSSTDPLGSLAINKNSRKAVSELSISGFLDESELASSPWADSKHPAAPQLRDIMDDFAAIPVGTVG